METQQLMISDWVLHEGEPYQIRQLGIYGINRDGEDYPAVCVGKPKGIGLIIERNEIAPIPLTDEILEKNEFKFYCTDVFEEWKSKDKRITIHDEEYPNSFNKWSVHVDTEDMRTMGYFEITYVHELQHALRLCGIEKEIKV